MKLSLMMNMDIVKIVVLIGGSYGRINGNCINRTSNDSYRCYERLYTVWYLPSFSKERVIRPTLPYSTIVFYNHWSLGIHIQRKIIK